MSDNPAQFYTGLIAEAYALLRGFAPDVDLCERVVRELGEPALELGCGDGDPLIDLRHRGLDVEGLDSSGDMVERCRRRAEAEGVDVVVHEADMAAMDLGRQFQTIFLAGPTMNLLPDDATTQAALVAIHAHLAPGGRAFIPLFVPQPVADVASLEPKEHVDPDGTRLRCTVTSVERDESTRVQATMLRYERTRPGADKVEIVERTWLLHWHTHQGFSDLAASAGLSVDSITDYHGEPAAADAPYVHVTLSRP